MEKLTRHQFVQYLMTIKGATPITFVMETRPKMNKFGRTLDENGQKVSNTFLDRIVKRTRMNAFLNFNYENAVNRQLAREQKEAEFEAQQRTWGTHVTPCLIQHEGNYYLQVKVEKTYEAEYIHTQSGNRISIVELSDYLPPVSKSRTQGTDKEIKTISIKVENIISFNTKGRQFEVERF